MQNNHKFEELVYTKAIYYLSRIHNQKAGILQQVEENNLNFFLFKSSQFLKLSVQNKILLQYGGYLFKG